MNNFRLTCILFLNIIHSVSAVSDFKCYVCDECPFKFNFTADSVYIKSGCSRCLTTTEIGIEGLEKSLSNRRCLTETMDENLKAIGIDLDEGCSNISQIPFVTEIKHMCFCSKDLCNSSFNPNQMWICFIAIIYLLFQYV